MTLFALDALAADPATEAIILVSKPPHPSVLARLEAKLDALRKPTVVCCVGAQPRVHRPDRVGRDAGPGRRRGRRAAGRHALEQRTCSATPRRSGSGWRLADRRRRCSRASASSACTPAARWPTRPSHLLRGVSATDHPHRILDLGDDQYTVGRPHPDDRSGVRTDKIIEAASDPGRSACCCVDLVLGKGSHDNPAEPLAAAVNEARRIARARRPEHRLRRLDHRHARATRRTSPRRRRSCRRRESRMLATQCRRGALRGDAGDARSCGPQWLPKEA